MRSQWVVLADENRARVFARVGGGGWQDIRDLTRNRGGEDNGRELRLPDGMRKLVSAGGLAAHDDFLERLGRELKSARKRGEFDELVLVAPAAVLEVLVAKLDPATRRALAATAPENLVSLPVREARRAVAKRF